MFRNGRPRKDGRYAGRVSVASEQEEEGRVYDPGRLLGEGGETVWVWVVKGYECAKEKHF